MKYLVDFERKILWQSDSKCQKAGSIVISDHCIPDNFLYHPSARVMYTVKKVKYYLFAYF